MTKFINALVAVTLTALLATSCATDDFAALETGDEARDVTLTLSIPDFNLQALGSRAVDEQGIASVTVLGYNNAGECKSFKSYTGSDLTLNGSTTTLRISLPKGITRVEVAANATAILDNTPSRPLSEVWNTASLTTASNIVFWGKADLSTLLDNGYVMSLLRQTAKVTVKNQATASFSMSGVKVVNSSTKGSIAPKAAADGSTVLTVDNADPCNAVSEYVGESQPVYLYETAAGKAFLVLKGNYAGAVNYYKIALCSTGSNSQVALQRNHHYSLTIKEVSGAGYASESEAVNGEVSNRIIAEMKDHDENVYNIVASGDYALGVCKDIEVAADATTATAEIVVISADASIFESPLTVAAEGDCSAWITNIAKGSAAAVAEGSYSSPARAYHVALTLTANNRSTASRSGNIVVRFRDLVQRVKVVQAGTDFKRDQSRRVVLKIAGTAVTTDYFSWVDNSLIGVSKQAMGGVERTEGLHFSTETDAADYVYTFPMASGDKFKTKGRGEISVVQDGATWKVTLTNGNKAETAPWVSSFTITNSAGIDIEYPVYRTGVLHNITSATATAYQVPERRVTGWFYYETVPVKGSDGVTYYVLDRNLGAMGNGPFSLAAASLADNANTVGAYYSISRSKADNIKPNICPKGFTIPSADQLQAIGFKPGRYQAANGEMYYSASVAAAAGSLLGAVYLPTGGYTEGDNYKNSNHADVWTSTYLSGAQGFAEGSPEYMFWFMYLDVYGQRAALGNMRFVSGGGGQAGSAFKGMPVRCIRGDSSKGNTGGSGATPGPTPTSVTVYWANSSVAWSAPRMFVYDSNDYHPLGDWPGKAMTLEKGNLWKIDVGSGLLVIFNNGSSAQYPASGQPGWTASAGHVYCPAGDLGAWNPSEGYPVYWDNSASASWTAPTVHYWTDGGGVGTSWPGRAMTKVVGNIWKLTVPAQYNRIIVSNNGADETCTMELVPGTIYSKSNQATYKK